MTRHLPRRLLALALASAISAPAWSQTAPRRPTRSRLPAPSRPATRRRPRRRHRPSAFTVSDIRIEGLQRISAGTVFTYLPIERGDTVDAARSAEAIRALYKTGFFEDIRLDRQGDILVVTVVERPAINKLTFTGNKDIKTEDLTKDLKDIGLAEGETFDRLALDRVTQELQPPVQQPRQVQRRDLADRGAAGPQPRRRHVTVKEGKAAKIRHINLVGNEKYDDELITDNWESREHNWLSWYRRDDQYSREKLSGDIEKLNNFYLDRGYVDFSLDSTQVAISPDKRDMFITAGADRRRRLQDLRGQGQRRHGAAAGRAREDRGAGATGPGLLAPPAGIQLRRDRRAARQHRLRLRPGQPDPEHRYREGHGRHRLPVVPGPRVNVRRIVFKGNTRTADEVLRREMRQFEGAWYSQAAVDRSKVRLQRLGYFETVEVETPAVAGTDDQVDVVFDVKETTSGSFMLGVGYSQLSGVNTSVQLSENNFLGSGNRVSIAAQRSSYQKRYDFSFTNPYFTDEGMSLGYNLWWREFDYSDFNVAHYSTNSGAAQMFMGLPITEYDTVSALVGIDTNEILTSPGSTPQRILDYIDAVGNRTFHAWRTQLGYSRDTRNDYLMPSAGTYQRISAEVALPGSTVEYYKVEYDFSKYWPLSLLAGPQYHRGHRLRRQLRRCHVRHLCVSRRPRTARPARPITSARSRPTACPSSRTSTPAA